jgi:prophage antirepressor-like protein
MNKIILFESQKIRRIWYNEEWYFSVVDVVWVLSESKNPTDYLKKLRKRDLELWNYIGTNCPHIDMITDTWKKRKTLAWNIEQIFRIIQSIPSPNAEPFKIWLSKVWYQRVQEIENPELAQDRMKDLELIFTMLWEKVTTEISKTEKPETFDDSKKVAKRWWKVAWNARKETEKEIWKSVISKENFLELEDKKWLKKLKN